ncbi:unnamed protein product [Calypogeia fissa]
MGRRMNGFCSLLALALWCLCGSFSSLPMAKVGAFTIPAQYDGFTFPPKLPAAKLPVVLEAFIDPMCPDCRSAWPTIKSLVELYGSGLSLILHPFPVPFHHNAFFSARLLRIANNLNSSATVPLLELIYKNQESFSNDATADETPSSVVKRFVSLAEEVGLSFDEVYKGFLDSSTDDGTRISFKYGCSRYVTATPTYLVNGVGTEADETWSVGRWRAILEPLVGRASAFKIATVVDDGEMD